jgi:hypothetical protein
LIVQFQDDSKTFWGIAKLDAGELGELVSIFNSPSGPNAIIDQLRRRRRINYTGVVPQFWPSLNESENESG